MKIRMEPAKYVQGNKRNFSRGDYLEEVIDKKGFVKLNEIMGEIVFSETRSTGYGSCLGLKLDNQEKEIWWQDQKNMPIPALVGQTLRGFYGSNQSNDYLVLQGYELQTRFGKVLTRGLNSKKLEFVD